MEMKKHVAPEVEQLSDEELSSMMDFAMAGTTHANESETDTEILLAFDTLDYSMSGATSSEAPKVANDGKRNFSRFDPAKQYRFSQSFARREGVGANGAILVQFLVEFSMNVGFRSLSRNLAFVPITGEELADFLPWKSARTWQHILQRLVYMGLIGTSRELRKNNIDRTLAYAIRSDVQAVTSRDPICCNAGEARDYGLCAAVLLELIRSSRAPIGAEHGGLRRFAMRPKNLSELLPFSESSIKRAANSLSEKQLVLKQWNRKFLTHEYWIPEKSCVL